MIFVILGIIILVVSFVFALVSLIREQSYNERKIPFEKPEDGQKGPQIAQNQQGEAETRNEKFLANEKSTDDGMARAVKNIADKPQVTHQTDEPFPWEVSRAADEQSTTAESQKTLDQIREELAKITYEKKNQEKEEEEDELVSRGNLSGEVSISDLRRGSSEG